MAEIKREPIRSLDADGNETITFDENHTHSDILRYVYGDIGEDVVFLSQLITAEEA